MGAVTELLYIVFESILEGENGERGLRFSMRSMDGITFPLGFKDVSR